MFKKMMQAFGVGAPSVDTVLHGAASSPGGQLSGEVRLSGGNTDADVEKIELSLVAEVETGDDEKRGMELRRVTVAESSRLGAEEQRTIPFTVSLPWETPITEVRGEQLRGMRLGLRTEVAIAKAVDKSDLDPVRVEPLDSQQRVVDAMLSLGARVSRTDVEHGHIRGLDQEFPCYQEIEFFAPPHFAGRLEEIELTFVARPDDLDVVLEAGKRGGLFTPGGDALGRFHRNHEEALRTDWTAEINRWLEAVSEGGGQHGVHGHRGHHGHHEEHGSGPGVGGMVAAGAAGVVGGMVAAEMLEGDEEEAEATGEEMEMEGGEE
ncbi:sporulation-control protein [Saccharopolyspora lacisalsi]|uniref:Sporulation-control protein n=1 Tax=Halosaccharopolyspora lacisalsi TaxID=1000566 RepID=A0A839E8P9_9PSEU|nr:sporulation protein [Halosaccharopolyspora lacisalsi]MBA8827228.1 sporulation-control protein [Halosaccharopolyspora lacisalsi]